MRERQAIDQSNASLDANLSRNKEFYDRKRLANSSPADGINKNIIEIVDIDSVDSGGKRLEKLAECRLKIRNKKRQNNPNTSNDSFEVGNA